MAAAASDPSSPPQETIPVSGATGIGQYTIAPPTFLEKWGVVFVSVGGLWMLGVCVALMWFYVAHLPSPPAQALNAKIEDYKAILEAHKTATDQFRDSLSFIFDLMVTRTVLPLLTLLLGYLFGSKKT
jgi:hypothetical protein